MVSWWAGERVSKRDETVIVAVGELSLASLSLAMTVIPGCRAGPAQAWHRRMLARMLVAAGVRFQCLA